jgi:predicted nucleotide-binding protein
MALNETKRQLLAKILDYVQETGRFPERQQFRSTIEKADRDALDQLVNTGLLYVDMVDGVEYMPTFLALGETREHRAFAAAEIQRALATLPILQSQYRDGVHTKQRSVAEMAEAVECDPGELRRTLRTMNRVRTMIGSWNPPDGNTFEKFTLTEGVLDIEADDLNPAARPAPEPGSLGVTLRPSPSSDEVAMDTVYALNRNARILLLRLHQAHLEVRGASFAYGYSEDDLPFDFPSYRAAAQRLEERGLAAWAGQTEVTSTASGVQAMEDPAILDELLPVGATRAVSMNDEVREANKKARRLLAFLHEWSLRAATFKIGPNHETFTATGLDEESYKRAADRLIRKRLARHFGAGYSITVTDEGLRVAESKAALDRELPVGADEGRVLSVADRKKVFVIHGRNLAARKQMGIFLRALELQPINFDDLRANLGGTPTIADIVMAGMQQAHGVVALFTADEYAALRPELRNAEAGEAVERWQSRPNVLFEAGIAFGIDRKRVVIVKLGNVSLPSDFGGIHVLSPTNDPTGHRNTLRNTLNGMGCDVGDGSDWMKDGDFDAAVTAGLSEVRPKDPFRP